MQGTRVWSMVRELDPACCNGDLAQPNMYIRKKYQCSTYYLSLCNWERAKSFSSYPSYNTDLPLPWKEENQISTQTFSKSLTFTFWVETEKSQDWLTRAWMEGRRHRTQVWKMGRTGLCPTSGTYQLYILRQAPQPLWAFISRSVKVGGGEQSKYFFSPLCQDQENPFEKCL